MRTLLMALIIFISSNCYADNNIVAVTIAAEACGEGELGMQAVANTIANRSRAWRKTPAQIVTQKNQYYGATAKNRHKLYSQCKSVADKLANNIMEVIDLTNGATFFLLPKEPVRSWHGEKTVTIGAHTFYRESKG